MEGYSRRIFRVIECNVKCPYLKIDLERDFAAGVLSI